MTTYVIGDIHGGYKALVQCLERSDFDKEEDTLICLGDVCDGWSEVYECVEELLTINNLICLKGNHDDSFNDWIKYGLHPWNWLQGGDGTLTSYCKNLNKEMFIGTNSFKTDLNPGDLPESHIKFFQNQILYYIDHKNRMFVHGGFDRNDYVSNLKITNPTDFYWDRKLWNQALSCKNDKLKTADDFTEIFIGHTTTMNWLADGRFKHLRDESNPEGKRITYPIESGGIWNLDTGGGFAGKLTIMNVDTKEYFQSDYLPTLYINEKGRS